MRLPRTDLWLVCLAVTASMMVLPSRADEADDQYAVAAGHYAQQRWKLAVEEFQAFLAKYPNDARTSDTLFFLGEALVKLERHEEAGQRFQDYLRRDAAGQHARPALFRIGEAAYLAGKAAEAKDALQKFLKQYPKDDLNAYVVPYLGQLALAENRVAEAESLFRQGLTQYPQGSLQDDCRFGLARALEKQDKTGEAERLYLALAGKPSSRLASDSQLRLGAVQYASGKFSEAAESFAAFEANWKQSPQIGMARLVHGWALMKLGRSKDAATLFKQVAADSKLGTDACYWLGLAQKAQKDWTAAAKTLLEAAGQAPEHRLSTAIRFHAGDALLHAGDYPAARQQFDAVLQSPSGLGEWGADAMLGICQAALRQKDHETIDRQSAEFMRRFSASPLRADVKRIQARSLIERKQYQKAADLLGPLVAGKEPGAEAAEERYLLGLAYEGLKRYDQALAAIGPVLNSANAPFKTDAQLAQALVFVATKRYAEAIPPLESFLAASVGPDAQSSADLMVKARGNLAICLARTKELDKAKKLYAGLIEKYPQHELIVPMTEQLADAAYDAGDTAWSQALFAQLADQGRAADKQMAGLAGLGWSQYKAGQLEQAAATFGQVLAKSPDAALAAETALVRGQILQKLEQSDDALAMFDVVIQRHPASREMPQALLAAARLRHRLQQNERAAELLQRLVKEFPKFPEMDSVLYDWGWVLADQAKSPESSAAFERLRKDYPKSRYWLDATFRLAQRAFAEKQFARARELAQAALAREPDPTLRENLLFLAAQIAAGEERWQEAHAGFELLVKQYPSGSLRLVAEYGAAESLFRLGDYDAARTRFQQLARDSQGRDKTIPAVARLRQAQALCSQKKWDEAYQIASLLAADYPGFEEQYEVDYVLGRCLANRAEFDKAREAYRRVIVSPGGAKTKTAANAQLMIAETYFHQKNFETALREYLKVEILYAFPAEQAASLLQAGKCHEQLREWKQAAEVYARLVDRYADTAFAKEAATRLQAAKQKVAETESK